MVGGTFLFNLAFFDIYFTDNAKGYLGMTRMPSFDSYYNLQEFAKRACFVPSLNVRNNERNKSYEVKKIFLQYLIDLECG